MGRETQGLPAFNPAAFHCVSAMIGGPHRSQHQGAALSVTLKLKFQAPPRPSSAQGAAAEPHLPRRFRAF